MSKLKAEQIEGLAETAQPVENEYYDTPLGITEMQADQGNQTSGFLQYVDDASEDPTVSSGSWYYEYLGTTTGVLTTDYRKLPAEEIIVILKGSFRVRDQVGANFKAKLDVEFGDGFVATKKKNGGFNVDYSETGVRFDDRLNEVGNTGATLELDYNAYELWNAVVNQAVVISIANGKPKVVTVDLTGDFAITYPANSTVIGDAYDGTIMNTLTIHYRDSSNILIIVNNWA